MAGLVLVDRLRRLPGFESLPGNVLAELAEELEERHVAAGAVVVREGDPGDRCFLFVEGRGEVSVERGGNSVSLRELGPGDSFGELALALPSGKRQATVTALTDLRLLTLDRKSFDIALAAGEATRDALAAHAERVAIAQFIGEVGAFARFDADGRDRLAARVVLCRVDPGEVIVREGEAGDRCFMLRSGSVEVIVARDGGEDQVDVLTPGALFGEASLLTGEPRIASVRALEACELLELGRDPLLEESRRSADVSRELTQLVRLREFPRRAEEVEVHERVTPDGAEQTVLKNPARGTYYRLSPRGRFVWDRLDGTANLRRLTLEYLTAFGQFAPQFVADLLSGLARGGFIEVGAPAAGTTHRGSGLALWWRAAASARRLLQWQWSLHGADGAVDSAYRRGVWVLFTRAGVIAMAVVSVFGVVAFVIVGRHASQLLSHAHGELLAFVYPGLFLSVAIHEAGHAFATKAFGRTVLRAGVGWYWFGPIAFVDTSDMWLGTRRQRIVVSLAGPAADLVTAGAVSIIALLVPNDTVAAGLWSLTLPLYFGVLLNLNPLLEFDGYHVLTDVLDRPNLRVEALAWVRRSFPAVLRSPRTAKGHLLELAYGVGSLLYIALMAALTVVFYRLVVRRLVESVLPSEAATTLAWVAAVTVVLLAASAAIADLRRLEHARDRLI
jgi:CRP-like cAMP-binding protein